MLKLFRTGVIVVALVPIGGGVAAADPNVADGCPTDNTMGGNVSNVCQFKDSTDGWHLIVRIDNITIESVPNLAATPTTREGYVTATATAIIKRTKSEPAKCPDETPPEISEARATCLTSGILTLNAVTGCQWDASTGLTLQPQFNFTNPYATTTFTPALTPIETTFGVLPGESENSYSQWTVKPGQNDLNPIGAVVFLSAPAQPSMTDDEQKGDGLTRVISVQEKLVRKEKCGGPVAVQLAARVTTRTSQSSTALTAYSDIVSL